MSAPARRDPVDVAAELHRTGQARVYDLARGREFVLSTPGHLFAVKVACVCAGGAAGWAAAVVALVVAGLTVTAIAVVALPFVAAAWWGLWCWRLRILDADALSVMRSRNRATTEVPRGGWVHAAMLGGAARSPSPSRVAPPGAEWGSMSRQQAALPQHDRGLPASSRRALQ